MKPCACKGAWKVLAILTLALLLGGAAGSLYADSASNVSLAATLRARTPAPRTAAPAHDTFGELPGISSPFCVDVPAALRELAEPGSVHHSITATDPRRPPARGPPSRV